MSSLNDEERSFNVPMLSPLRKERRKGSPTIQINYKIIISIAQAFLLFYSVYIYIISTVCFGFIFNNISLVVTSCAVSKWDFFCVVLFVSSHCVCVLFSSAC